MIRNVFAALTFPLSFALIKFGFTTKVLTPFGKLAYNADGQLGAIPGVLKYIPRFIPELVATGNQVVKIILHDNDRFSGPAHWIVIIPMRGAIHYGSVSIPIASDLYCSWLYGNLFKEEFHEFATAAGDYFEKNAPAAYKFVIQNANYYLPPVVISSATAIITLSTDAIRYLLSPQFIEDIAAFKEWTYKYHINLIDVASTTVVLIRDFDEWTKSGFRINLIDVAKYLAVGFINISQFIYEWPAQILYHFFSSISGFPTLVYAFAKDVISWAGEQIIKFIEATLEWFNYISEVLYLIDFQIDLYPIIGSLVKFIDEYQPDLSFVVETLDEWYEAGLNLWDDLADILILIDKYATLVMDLAASFSFGEIFDLPIEVYEQWEKDFIEWWNEPSDSFEALAALGSTTAGEIFIGTNLLILWDSVVGIEGFKRMGPKIAITTISSILRKLSQKYYDDQVALKKQLAIEAAATNNLSNQLEAPKSENAPSKEIALSPYTNNTWHDGSVNKFASAKSELSLDLKLSNVLTPTECIAPELYFFNENGSQMATATVISSEPELNLIAPANTAAAIESAIN